MTILYPLANQSGVYTDDGSYAVKDGKIDVPPELAESLRTTHINGVKAWEDENERHARLAAEESERQRDPATLLAEVQGLTAAVRSSSTAAKTAPARKRTARKRTPAKKATPAAAKKAPTQPAAKAVAAKAAPAKPPAKKAAGS